VVSDKKDVTLSALTLLDGSRNGIWPVKTEGVLVWLSVSGEVQICILPSRWHCHSLSLAPVNSDRLYQNGSAFLVPAYLELSWKKGC